MPPIKHKMWLEVIQRNLTTIKLYLLYYIASRATKVFTQTQGYLRIATDTGWRRMTYPCRRTQGIVLNCEILHIRTSMKETEF